MMKRTLIIASTFLLLTLGIVGWQLGRQPRPIALTPSLTRQTEYCLTCHSDLPQISLSHPVEVFGCVRCHGGERLALDADLAHSTLRGQISVSGRASNPSDLSTVEVSCGGADCHSASPDTDRNHIQRVLTGLHASYAGAIAEVRFDAGEQPDRSARLGLVAAEDIHLQTLSLFDPSQDTNLKLHSFAKNCQSCHLSAQSTENRFTGCAACHAQTAGADTTQPIHRLTAVISYSQCNTCHNQGVYNLTDMTFQTRQDQLSTRQEAYYLPKTQFTKCEYLLDCVDCHTRKEVMGDGALHDNQSEAETTQCRTCHGTASELPRTYIITQPDDLALRLAILDPAVRLQVGDSILVNEQGEPLWNTRLLPNGTYELVGKVTGQHFVFRPVIGSGCLQNPYQQEASACHECHSTQH